MSAPSDGSSGDKERPEATVERLRADNFRLGSIVNELQLETSYYRGELKRLEWEKNNLRQDVTKMSTLFKSWLHELRVSNKRSVVADTDYFTNLVKRPAMAISDVFRLHERIFLTSCQEPFFIEYVSAPWTAECGWEADEVLGCTPGFLQGEATDLAVATAFTKDVKEVGYGSMRLNNYRKNGEVFSASISVFPVYDSVAPTVDDDPILTHFATVITRAERLDVKDILPVVPRSVANCLAEMLPSGNAGLAAAAAATSPSSSSSSSSSSGHGGAAWLDRRTRCRRFDTAVTLAADSFVTVCADARLSDLLRLMLCVTDAMALADAEGRIVHVNKAWTALTGYTLSEATGRRCEDILAGPMTDGEEMQRCTQAYLKDEQPASAVTSLHRKDRTPFPAHATFAPVRGGSRSLDVTHVCALFVQADPDPDLSSAEPLHPPVAELQPLLAPFGAGSVSSGGDSVNGATDTGVDPYLSDSSSSRAKRSRDPTQTDAPSGLRQQSYHCGSFDSLGSSAVLAAAAGDAGAPGAGGSTLPRRDYNFFECEMDEEDECEDVTVQYGLQTAFLKALKVTDTPQLDGPARPPTENKNARMLMDVDSDSWAGPSQGSLASGVTDNDNDSSGRSSEKHAGGSGSGSGSIVTRKGVADVPLRQPMSTSGKAAAAGAAAAALHRSQTERQAAAESLATLAEPTRRSL